ncbi:TBC1 domain family member 12 isoform X1 [Oreochromis niloticus]|uniref:TBC1 domain family member 12 n=2 Tax=Oreochromis niloticus TaxID=8128 RepID=A0A669DCI5_ORENI|nr:TBC1 domain family member 12 isoform X1 [Oreochromis niloticus]
METVRENGGSFGVDLNENEEGERGGGAGKSALRDRSIALLAGVSAVHDAGKAFTGLGRDVNTDASLKGEIMLERLFPGPVSGVCGDHSGLNGFTEEELPVVELEVGGGGLGLEGTTAASCPAVLTVEKMRGDSKGEARDSDCVSPGGEATGGGCIRTSLPGHELACAVREHRRNCACTAGVNMPNGAADSCEGEAGLFPTQQLRVCDCEDVKVANGGFHTRDQDLDSGCSPENTPECQLKSESRHDKRLGSPGLSAKPPSPCPSSSGSPLSERNTRDEEEEEDEEGGFSDPSSPPVRPQSLRTNPNVAVSLSCDATPLSPEDEEDGGFYFEGYDEDLRGVLEAGRRQSAPDTLPDLTQDSSDPKQMPKRFGIADFFTRSLFSRKPKEPKATSHSSAGWRLFGKTAAREGDTSKDLASTPTAEQSPQQEPMKDSSVPSCPQRAQPAGKRRNLEFEPLSTTALILEDRPSNLPAKSTEETQRHKLEYEEMVAGAKRRELKEAQRKKRQMKERHRQEDSISNAMVTWNTEILPHWDSMKGTRRVRELWWQGLPPSVRGRVWSLAIGNELNITPELYEIFLSRAKEKWRSYSETSSVNDSESDGGASLADRESSLDLIKLDISRTFPSLFIFQKGGPYHDLLHSVLGAYTCYRPDIGYVQGMSFIAAVLILNLEEAEAFITFANLLNKPCQMAFFRVDHELMLKYFAAFEIFFEENLPRLFSHFQTNSLTPDLYLIDWIFTLYSKSLPLDVACRVWDVFCRDGEESLFRTGLGILRLYEDVLLQMDFIHIAQFLTRLPEDLQSHTLFNAMASTHMISRNRRWAQVFSALMKDGNKEADKNTSPALRS